VRTIAQKENAMRLSIAAIYANGVFVPEKPVALEEQKHVHLEIEPIDADRAESAPVERRRLHRIRPQPPVARDIAESGEFDLFNG
jgi:predicted DNA-binding antitoxin AbrB/MazE fold protein